MGNTGFTINPKLYDFLKWIALTVLPAVATLIIGLGETLNWSGAPAIAGVVTLVDMFLGAILGKSSSNFKDQATMGDLVISQDQAGVPTGMRIVATKDTPIFTAGSHVLLNVKREQQMT